MNNILKLNEQSQFLNSFSKISQDIFEPGLVNKVYPNLVKEIKTVLPYKIETGPDKYIFKLPDEGFLMGMVIKTVINYTEGATAIETVENEIGARLYDNVEFLSYGKLISRNPYNYAQMRADDEPNDYTLMYQNMMSYNEIVSGQDMIIYTPYFTSSTDTIKNTWLLDHFSNLELSIKRKVDANDHILGFPADSTEVTFEPTLLCFITHTPADFKDYHRYKFYREPLNYLSYDVISECFDVSSGTTTTTVDIATKSVSAFCIHAIIRSTSDYSTKQITNLKIENDNRTVIDIDTINLLPYDTGRAEHDMSYHSGNKTASYYFGLSKDRHSISGSLLLNTNLRVTVDYETLPTDGELCILIEYYTILSTDPHNGRIYRGLVF